MRRRLAKPTALGLWLKAANPKQRKELADLSGTTVAYLYQLAGGHSQNPKLRLALAIVLAINLLHHKSGKVLPLVQIEELAVNPYADVVIS